MCHLTDGYEIFATKTMTYEEFEEAGRQAKISTDGNVWWGTSIENLNLIAKLQQIPAKGDDPKDKSISEPKNQENRSPAKYEAQNAYGRACKIRHDMTVLATCHGQSFVNIVSMLSDKDLKFLEALIKRIGKEK